jgi:heme-degrading monooxygenase HmoA
LVFKQILLDSTLFFSIFSPYQITVYSWGSFMAVKIFIRRVIAEEKINDLLPLFRRLRNLATNQPGYISGETLKRIDSPDQYLVISTWQSLDAWRKWVVSRERIEVQKEIDARIDEETVYEIYQYG